MLNIVNSIYPDGAIKPKKRSRTITNQSAPMIYDDVLSLLKTKPYKRKELLSMGFKWSSLDKTIRIMTEKNIINKCVLTNSLGHKMGVVYSINKEI